MKSLKEVLPQDSILHLWLQSRAIIEPPVSYDLLTGMSSIGAILKRSCWIDQEKFKVYPNMSVLLVGPTGIGKDTAIDGAEEILQYAGQPAVIGGMTPEQILTQLLNVGDPAAAVILAPELSDFFGSQDYRKGMLQAITELLSTKSRKDISLKSAPDQIIQNPTITILAGSTPQWLHTAMPSNAMGGGFYPRFVICCEHVVKKHVPLVKYSTSKEDIHAAGQANVDFLTGISELQRNFCRIGALEPTPEAIQVYETWYPERQRVFSKLAADYAHRSRDHVLRMALICAVSRFKKVWDAEDVMFAITLIEHIARRIDEAIVPPTPQAALAKQILKLMPILEHEIYAEIGDNEGHRTENAIAFLRTAKQIYRDSEGFYRINKKEERVN